MAEKYTHILWDWNGTLLDDADWCISVLNSMLERRGLRTLSGLAEYREVFGFPIIDYYLRVGFDFSQEPFEALAHEYMSLYHRDKTGGCGLHEGAETALRTLSDNGLKQAILTASERGNLMSQMREFDIMHYFDVLLGLEDVYAASKVEIGLAYLEQERPEKAVMIGDSLHDFEVSRALGIDCLLVANVHHSAGRLSECGVPVLSDISQVTGFVFS